MTNEQLPQAGVPKWAWPIREHLDTFLELVMEYFHRRQLKVELHFQGGLVTPQADTAEPPMTGVLSLHRLARQCAQREPGDWRKVIQEYLDCLLAAGDILPPDFREVSERLRSRLYPTRLLKQVKDILARPGPEGTIEVVVVDMPSAVRTVSAVEAKQWGLPLEQLFELGRRNLRRALQEQMHQFTVNNDVVLHIFSGDNFYTASGLLIAEHIFPPHLPHGALVSIPRHDVLLAHYIHNIGAAEALDILVNAALQLAEDEVGRLTTNLYWYRDGQCVHIPWQEKDDELSFSLPEELEAVLESLHLSAMLS